MDDSAPGIDLSIVVPAHNEEVAIGALVMALLKEASDATEAFEVRVYDDGSSDQTAEVLRRLADSDPRLVVTSQPNRGHGPTILRGYAESRGEWIFQLDGDGEVAAEEFAQLWSHRHACDIVLGIRAHRNSPVARRMLTICAARVVRLLFGGTLKDVNVPCRLLRRSSIRPMLPRIQKTFAPNVLVAALANAGRLRVTQVPIGHVGRTSGRSLSPMRLASGAMRTLGALIQLKVCGRAGLGANRSIPDGESPAGSSSSTQD